MNDRRFEERIAELEAEAAESEANAAKWAQESIDFEDRLRRAETSIATLEAANAKLRDLLRRVYACAANGSSAVDTTVRLALLLPEISKAIEPSGDAGELKP